MGGGDYLQDAVHAAGGEGLAIAFEHRLERLLLLPLRMLRRQALHLVQGEEHLEVHRLLAPQGTVVIEHGDALGWRHEVLAALAGHGFDESHDRLARSTVIPRWQLLRCLHQQRQAEQQEHPAGKRSSTVRGHVTSLDHGFKGLRAWAGRLFSLPRPISR